MKRCGKLCGQKNRKKAAPDNTCATPAGSKRQLSDFRMSGGFAIMVLVASIKWQQIWFDPPELGFAKIWLDNLMEVPLPLDQAGRRHAAPSLGSCCQHLPLSSHAHSHPHLSHSEMPQSYLLEGLHSPCSNMCTWIFVGRLARLTLFTRSLASKLALELLATQHNVDFFLENSSFFNNTRVLRGQMCGWILVGDAGAHKYTGHSYQPET